MSRLSRIKTIDGMIDSVQSIAKNQCSLSEQDLTILDEIVFNLQALKGKKGKTNKQIQNEFAKSLELLNQFLLC